MVVNHIDKTFVTSDAATILKEVSNLVMLALSGPPSCQNALYGL